MAELTAVRKCQKYANIPSANTFLSIAMETLGSINDSAYHFFKEIDRKISEVSGDSVLTQPCSTKHSLGKTIDR